MRRYSSRQNVSFGSGGDGVRRLQGILIIALTIVIVLMLVVYFAFLRPAATNNEVLRQRYRSEMQNELKQALNVANKDLSRTAGWDSNVAKLRSYIYGVSLRYSDYRLAGGELLAPFERIDDLLTALEDYIARMQEGGTSTGNIVTTIQNGLNEMMELINPNEAL